MMIPKYEYKVETIDKSLLGLSEFLNKQASDGWRCVSVCLNTGFGLTFVVVLEREISQVVNPSDL